MLQVPVTTTSNQDGSEDGGNICLGNSSSSLSSSQSTLSSTEPEPEPADLPTTTVTLEECSQIYVAGYLAYNYNKKFKCDRCLQIMCDLNSVLTSKKELLILNKTFTQVKLESQHGLKAPSEAMIHVVTIGLKVFKKMFNRLGHKANLVKRLVTLTKQLVCLDSLTCKGCSEKNTYVLITLFKLMVFKQCKWISDSLKASALNKIKLLQHV